MWNKFLFWMWIFAAVFAVLSLGISIGERKDSDAIENILAIGGSVAFAVMNYLKFTK